MTPLQRSRRLQTGLAGLGIVGAVGASFGIGAATHTGSSAGTSDDGTVSGSRSSGSSDSSTHHAQRDSSAPSPSPSPSRVTAPTPSPPQATTQGS